MKRLIEILSIAVAFLFFFLVCVAHGQGFGSVQLTWNASSSECESACKAGTGPTLVNVYSSLLPPSGSCAAGPTWNRIATGVPASGPYLDSPNSYGVWCYMVRAYFVSNPQKESLNSNLTAVQLSPPAPAAPTVLKVTVQ